ncbi:RNA polymerase sigma factor [Metabacillus dongyingensis]|uniref:RNA polymerase sigma factor n=1 Tax=Metabacillus dongyingensis TaxID=2874282 RepID=UPI003B8BC8D4
MSDKERITEWFSLYSEDLYHYLIYFAGFQEAEDLLQETFIRAIKGIKYFNENSSPKTWLFSIARNAAIDELRKKKRNKWMQALSFKSDSQTKTVQTPETLLAADEQNRNLYKGILSLKHEYRDVLILRGIKEFSQKESASILGWKEDKVRSVYYRAKKALLKEMEGSGYDPF